MTTQQLLVVDDDESVVEYLQAALEMAGYAVTTASTATEALGKLKAAAGKFPVVVSDIMMPGLTGLEFLHIVKKEYPEILVIMLTANTTMDSAVKALNEGAFGFLTKPVNINELTAALNNAFDKYRLLLENHRLVEELNKEKDYLETIVQNLVYIVVATDPDGTIRKTNRAVEKLLGFSEQELIGSPLQAILSKETPFADLAGNGHVKNFPVTFLAKDGRELKLSFTGSIMKDPKGQVVGFLGTAG